MHLAIRVDGGPEIGYGHLIRSNALAEEFIGRDHQVTVATATPQPARSVFPNAVETIELRSRGNPKSFVDWINKNPLDAVFTDSYPVNTEYQRVVRERAPLVVLQDDDRHEVCADLFVNGNLYARDLDYEFAGSKAKTCLGADYVLLRSEIRDWAEDEPPWREQPERALVMMGGSDVTNLMPTVVRAFDGFDLQVDAIVGPGFSDAHEQLIRTTSQKISANVSVVRDPDNLAERMFQADFAVSTSSSTTYELLALGTPIISIPVVDNQALIARALRERDAGIILEKTDVEDKIKYKLTKYMSNESLRKKHQKCGLSLVDGDGTIRVADEIEAQIERYDSRI